MVHQVSFNTVAYAVMYYATDVAAIMYNSNAQANNFVLWDKGQTRELSIVSDDAWDNTKLTWVKKYDSSEQPTQNTIWSDAYGFYDEYFRLKYSMELYIGRMTLFLLSVAITVSAAMVSTFGVYLYISIFDVFCLYIC